MWFQSSFFTSAEFLSRAMLRRNICIITLGAERRYSAYPAIPENTYSLKVGGNDDFTSTR